MEAKHIDNAEEDAACDETECLFNHLALLTILAIAAAPMAAIRMTVPTDDVIGTLLGW